MQAVILASGEGKRLRPLTETTPKPLIELKLGQTILGRILDSLAHNQINNILITTGHLEEKIKEFVSVNYQSLKPVYVRNEIYDKTNNIYSLWLTKNYAHGDVLVLHGDLVFDSALISKISASNTSAVLVKKREFPKKDFKARVGNDNLVKEIGVSVAGEDAAGFCMPIYKFLANDWQKLLKKMDWFIQNGQVNNYFEDALNAVLDEIKLHPIFYEKEFAMEVDDFEDLEKARKLL